jgi:hypothetical protein
MLEHRGSGIFARLGEPERIPYSGSGWLCFPPPGLGIAQRRGQNRAGSHDILFGKNKVRHNQDITFFFRVIRRIMYFCAYLPAECCRTGVR